uniref:Vegetative incompatibility protein 1b n=1 Tax=Cryphonectria parasitica TaxID=5116 RepID=W1I7E9_CRYPA|nr:vegetative incompatibility protein 1b [Cryphonectria parasitica]
MQESQRLLSKKARHTVVVVGRSYVWAQRQAAPVGLGFSEEDCDYSTPNGRWQRKNPLEPCVCPTYHPVPLTDFFQGAKAAQKRERNAKKAGKEAKSQLKANESNKTAYKCNFCWSYLDLTKSLAEYVHMLSIWHHGTWLISISCSVQKHMSTCAKTPAGLTPDKAFDKLPPK